ncbi:amidohydrolase family protein [Xanthocytophaga agilis]|uniref:Amidohydrolase family protein n=1 Tax=Xanthocytophaga agilis TaxID=3048010 RepID=A0AAE3R9B4_9BACT|nr:amidohydrolase family protein [Xanthocytophaga agilis]MDJ1503122.1 amidohydrolase family protein [Xanthocytophaga agilis]
MTFSFKLPLWVCVILGSLLLCYTPDPSFANNPTSFADSLKVTLTEGTNMAISISPDRKWLALDVQGTIWVLSVTGGEAHPVTDAFGDNRQPAWSPDGSQIAFQSFRDGTYHIWTVKKDGSGLKQQTFGVYDDREPHWAPDGKSLVFSSDRADNYDIWQLDMQSGKIIQLTTDIANDYCPAYNAEGTRIVFVSERSTGPGVYVREDNGKEKLVSKVDGKLCAPAWNSTGTHISYNAFSAQGSFLEQIRVSDGNKLILSDPQEDVFPFRAEWLSVDEFLYTADGQIKRRKVGKKGFKSIPFKAIVTIPKRNYARKRYSFDNHGPMVVKGIKGPVVSPDGRRIAFAALSDIWILENGKAEPMAITHDPYLDVDPAWSPDGSRLVYISDRNGGMDLWMRNLKTEKDSCLVDLPDDLNFPAWSPDGTKIAFYQGDPRNAWGRGTLSVINLSSGKIEKVHESLFVPSQPSWSADNKTIAISSLQVYSSRYREGISEILLVSLDGKPDRYVSPVPDNTLAMRGKNGPVWSPDGSKMAYTLDGLLWMVPVDLSGNLVGPPKRLTNELAEVPSWTGDSQRIVFLATDTLKQVSVADGKIEVIPMHLTWQYKQASESIIVHAGQLFNGLSATYQKNVDIVIEGNRIKEIVPHQTGRIGKIIDASDKTVIPGLFEMHTHQYAMTGEKQGRLWLSYGITSIREPGADPYDALERKESWASGARKGPRQFFTGGLTDGSRIYYGLATSIHSEAHLELELKRSIRLEYDLIKTYVRMPDLMQQRITTFAHAHGIPVSSHEIYPAMGYAVDAVEHIGGTSRRGYSPKISAVNRTYQDVIELLAKSEMNITPTAALQGGFHAMAAKYPALYENRQYTTFYSPEFTASMKASTGQIAKLYPGFLTNFASLQSTVKRLIAAGAHVTTGTDSPFVPYGTSLHTELQCWVDGGVTPFEALRSATLWAAEAVGVSKDLGSVEPGKLADLVIVTGDPLTQIRDAWNVETVIKNGEVYSLEELLKRP